MRNFRLPLCFSLLILAAAITLSCGTSSTTRSIQSVTISPASADAQNYPDGQVPFTATGYYTTIPSPVTPQTATWGACYQNAATTAVAVSGSGVAQCVAGASGTYTIWAFVIQQGLRACPTFVTACGGGGCQVTGTAQLTCP
jgi:hypothetical protein